MSGRQSVSVGTSWALRKPGRTILLIAAWALPIALPSSTTAIAATYTYTPTSSITDQWSAGTNWSAVPLSAPSTELTFVGDNATVLSDGLTNTNTDDIAGPFSLNILNLQGTGPVNGAGTINIGSSYSNYYLSFVANGGNGPVVNLSAVAGNAGLVYNVNPKIWMATDTTFQGDGTATFQLNGILGGYGDLTKAGDSTLILACPTPIGVDLAVSGGTLQLGDGRTRNGSVTGFITNNAALVFANPTDQTYDHIIKGSGSLTKSGAGKLTLAYMNSYTGDTKITGGTLKLSDTLAIYKSTLDYGDYGGQLSFGSTSLVIGGLKGCQDLALTSGSSAVALSIGNNNQSTTYSGVLSGPGSLNKVGTGTLTLTGVHGYSGKTTISAGILALANTNALPNSVADVAVANGLAFAPGIGVFSLGGLSGSKELDLTDTSGHTVELRVGNNNQSTSFSGAISGAGSLNKIGAGTLKLLAASSFFGGTTLSGGKLEFSPGALGAGSITFNGGSLHWTTANTQDISSQIAPIASGQIAILDVDHSNVSFASSLSGSGGLTVTGAGTLNFIVANRHAGGTTINGSTVSFVENALGTGPITLTGKLRWAAGNIQDISGQLAPITGGGTLDTNGNDVSFASAFSGSGGLSKTGAGTLTLVAANTYTGMFGIGEGSVQLANSNALQNSYASTAADNGLRFAPGIGVFTLGGLSGSTNVDLTDTNGDPVELQVGNDNGTHGFSGTFTGAGSLTKIGSGTLNLSLANSYAGATTIRGGTLSFVKDALGAGDIAFEGGTLSWASGNNQGIADRNVTVASDRIAVLDTHGNNVSVTVPISGGGGVTKSGAGTLTLIGANTYSGGTTVAGGALQLGDGATNGSVMGDIANTGAVIFANSSDQTYSGVISGNGSLSKNGAGNLTLSGKNTHYGDTTLGEGTLILGDVDALQNSTLNHASFGTLSFGTLTDATLGGLSGTQTLSLTNDDSASVALTVGGNGKSTVYSGRLSGGGSLTKTGNFTLALTGANAYEGGTTLCRGRLSFGNGSLGATGAITFDGGTLQWNGSNTQDISSRIAPIAIGQAAILDTNGNNVSFASALTGGGGLRKTGAGTLALAEANAYAGATTISGGALSFANGALDSSSALVFDGGALQWASGNSQDISGRISNDQNAILDTNGNDVSFASPLGGRGAMTKTGAGALALTVANTYTGGTTISGGTLSFTANALGPSGGIQFQGGTLQWASGNSEDVSYHGLTSASDQAVILDTNGNNISFARSCGGQGGLVKSGEGTLTLTGDNHARYVTINAGVLQLGDGTTNGFLLPPSSSGSMTVTNNGGLIFNTNVDSEHYYPFSKRIGGTGSVTKSGTGRMVLTGVHTYTGGTIINGGTLQVGGSASTGTTSLAGDIINHAALVFYSGISGASMKYAGAISGTGTVTIDGGQLVVFAGRNTYTGDTIINCSLALGDGVADGSLVGNITNNAWLTFRNEGDQVYSGIIGGKGNVSKTGNGTLTLTGANTYTGRTEIRDGTLILAGPSTYAGDITLDGDCTLQLGDGVFSNGAVAGDIWAYGVPFPPARCTVVFANPLDQTYSGTLGGRCNVVKTGEGTLVLDGVTGYLSTTTIDAGTLALGVDNVLSTGMDVVLDGGTLAANGFDQTNPLGELTLSSDSMIDMGATGGSILRFADSHAMSWSDTLTITNWSGFLTGGGADELSFGASGSALSPDQLSDIIFANPNGLSGNYPARILATGEIVPVPEPATAALLATGGLLLGGLALRCCRRRRMA